MALIWERVERKLIEQGLPYPTDHMFGGCGLVGGYPFRPDWVLNATDPGSWLLGQLEGVAQVEQFTGYELKVVKPPCDFNTLFWVWKSNGNQKCHGSGKMPPR